MHAPLRLAACATPALHRCSSYLLADRADNAEAQVDVPVVVVFPVLVAHLAVAGVVVPAAAASVAFVAAAGVGIPAPFPNVAATNATLAAA
ncbi:hypothetical protein, partial [uncultured Treponema sp.]|uniref:hypothetical protein n=1 Tax=uncultured Treponema sp. TaxID=162155 RepID=UPI00338E2238